MHVHTVWGDGCAWWCMFTLCLCRWCVSACVCSHCEGVKGVRECWCMFTLWCEWMVCEGCCLFTVCEGEGCEWVLVHVHTLHVYERCVSLCIFTLCEGEGCACALVHVHTVWGWQVWMLVHVHTVCVGERCEWVLVLVHTVCVSEGCAWLMAHVYTVWEDKNNMCECWCTLTVCVVGRCWNNFGSCFSFSIITSIKLSLSGFVCWAL